MDEYASVDVGVDADAEEEHGDGDAYDDDVHGANVNAVEIASLVEDVLVSLCQTKAKVPYQTFANSYFRDDPHHSDQRCQKAAAAFQEVLPSSTCSACSSRVQKAEAGYENDGGGQHGDDDSPEEVDQKDLVSLSSSPSPPVREEASAVLVLSPSPSQARVHVQATQDRLVATSVPASSHVLLSAFETTLAEARGLYLSGSSLSSSPPSSPAPAPFPSGSDLSSSTSKMGTSQGHPPPQTSPSLPALSVSAFPRVFFLCISDRPYPIPASRTSPVRPCQSDWEPPYLHMSQIQTQVLEAAGRNSNLKPTAVETQNVAIAKVEESQAEEDSRSLDHPRVVGRVPEQLVPLGTSSRDVLALSSCLSP